VSALYVAVYMHLTTKDRYFVCIVTPSASTCVFLANILSNRERSNCPIMPRRLSPNTNESHRIVHICLTPPLILVHHMSYSIRATTARSLMLEYIERREPASCLPIPAHVCKSSESFMPIIAIGIVSYMRMESGEMDANYVKSCSTC
jgi:hypothetical protein